MENKHMPKMIDFKELQPLIEKCYEFQNKGFGTVFINISGHVGHIDIQLHTHGWRASGDADFENNIDICLDSKYRTDIQTVIDRIDYFMDEMETVEEHEQKWTKYREESERKRYEELKQKFES